MSPVIFTRIRISAITFISFSLIFLLLAPITSAEVIELNVDPQVVNEPGDEISITGKATEPNEKVWISSSFEIPLNVSADGKYSREFNNIHFIGGKTDFSLRAENIKNIGLRLSFEQGDYNLGPITATKGIATISVSVPFSKEIEGVIWELPALPPEMDIEVYGDAADDATSVNLKVATTLKSLIRYTPLPEYPPLTDSSGNFSIRVNTEGIPQGKFVIIAGSADGIGRIEKTVYIGVTPTPTPSPSPTPTPTTSTDTSTPSPTPSPSPSPSPRPTPSPSPTLSPSPSPSPTPTSTSTPTTTLAPTASPTVTPAPVTPTADSSSTPAPTPSKRWIPGFEAVFVIAGLLAVAYLVLRRKRE